MKKVNAKAKLFKDPNTGWRLALINQEQVRQECRQTFITNDTIVSMVLDMQITRPRQEKTHSQLGYMHAAMWPVFYKHQELQGEVIETDEDRVRVRDAVKSAIGFVEEIHDIRGDRIIRIRSFAHASIEETSQAIDRIIRLAAEMGLIIPDPEEYLEAHGLEDFNG